MSGLTVSTMSLILAPARPPTRSWQRISIPSSRATLAYVTQTALVMVRVLGQRVAVAAMLSVAAVMRHLQPLPSGRVILPPVWARGAGQSLAYAPYWRPGPASGWCWRRGHGIDEVHHRYRSTRLEVTFTGPGGHSWGALGPGVPSTPWAVPSTRSRGCKCRKTLKPLLTSASSQAGSVNTIALRYDARGSCVRSIQPSWLRLRAAWIVCSRRPPGYRCTGHQSYRRFAARRGARHGSPACCGVSDIRHYLRLRRRRSVPRART